MGGGGYTFTGWSIVGTKLDTTPNGVYVPTVAAQSVTIVGTGNELNVGSKIKHTSTITSTTITTVKTN